MAELVAEGATAGAVEGVKGPKGPLSKEQPVNAHPVLAGPTNVGAPTPRLEEATLGETSGVPIPPLTGAAIGFAAGVPAAAPVAKERPLNTNIARVAVEIQIARCFPFSPANIETRAPHLIPGT